MERCGVGRYCRLFVCVLFVGVHGLRGYRGSFLFVEGVLEKKGVITGK